METIREDALKAIAELCNQIVLVEYDMILGYPRLIDHLVNFEKISDKQVLGDLEKLGKDSLGHFNKTDRLMTQLGSQIVWTTSTYPRLVDPIYELNEQLGKEKEAFELYQKARKIALDNKIEAKPKGLLGKLFGMEKIREEDLIIADEVIYMLERHMEDERRHLKLTEDSIATLKMLMNR
ncbi:hypothetical protein ACFLVO_02975 [Chloroflexota bacterium]